MLLVYAARPRALPPTPPMPVSARRWSLIPLLAATLPPWSVAAADYDLGAGYRLEYPAVTLGGYATARAANLEGRDARVEVSDLSLFISAERGARWRFFTELEVGEPLAVEGGDVTTDDAEFDLERLYADYAANPGLNVRVGKFLTPIGRWNEVHADPLVWTTSRPTVTELPFSRQATGAMLYGDLVTAAGTFEYSAFGDATLNLDPLREQEALESYGDAGLPSNNFEHGAGGRLRRRFAGDRLVVGGVVAWYEMRGQRDSKYLAGMDAALAVAGVEVTAEALYRFSARDEGRVWGAYLQAVRALVPGLFGIARVEAYAPETGGTARAAVLGLAWRARQGLVLKGEYRAGTHNEAFAADGWLGSISVLF